MREGYEMMTNVVDAEPGDVTIGASVRVRFVDVSPEMTLPCFELIENPA
jgi:hypothetical protein